MPERGFNTEFWADTFIEALPPEGKLLYAYLWTNPHCNQAGLYKISLSRIAYETKLPAGELPSLLESLEPKVKWYPDENLIWVKNFIKHQTKSPKFLIAAIDRLNAVRNHLPEGLEDEFYFHNERLLASVNLSREPSLTKRDCVIIRDNFLCQYCGKEILNDSDYELDHVVPRIKGGKDHYQNLVTSCHACNAKKLDKTPEEAGMPHPGSTTFHASQAIFLLKNDSSIREKWVRIFPDKQNNIDLILGNIVSRYTTSASASASAKSSADSEEIGVVKGEEAVKGKAPQFELFWKAYPKKRNKGQAERAFKKAAPDEQLMAAILTVIERAKKSAQWLKDDGQFIPYPATWLNAKGWEDEYITPQGGADGVNKRHSGPGPVQHTAEEFKASLKGAKRERNG